MFKKFTPSTDIATSTKVKSSVQRAIRADLIEQMPLLGENDGVLLEAIWPKKEAITHIKCREHVSIYALNGEPLFFQHFDGPYYPTLRLLHKYPTLLPHLQIDRGAIRFILAGANMMCPGFTSQGGRLPPSESALPLDAVVAIHAEGKEHAVGLGILKMSTEEIKKVNKGVGVEVTSYLGDDLWTIEKI